jgi:hypothetical protein
MSRAGERIFFDDILFEVRRACRLGLSEVELRKRMACPSCATTGRAFDPGPVLLRVPVVWTEEAPLADQVVAAAERCRQEALELGLEIEPSV